MFQSDTRKGSNNKLVVSTGLTPYPKGFVTLISNPIIINSLRTSPLGKNHVLQKK